MKTTTTIVIGVLAVAITASAPMAQAADATNDIKEFTGHFQTGLYIKFGESFHSAPIFMDPERPPVIKASEDKAFDNILKDVCKNGEDLKIAPAVARQLDKMKMVLGKDMGEVLHIAVFPVNTTKVSDEIKSPAFFQPASTTNLDTLVTKYGTPTEKERWIHKQIQTWVGLHGTVHWWGAIGIAASENGTITHILVREREGVMDHGK